MIGCDCAVCHSTDERDQRNRPSIMVIADGVSLLIDTPPELRLSCIKYGIRRADAVLFTHHHADHILGLDDVRRFNLINDEAMRCYGSSVTLEEVRKTFRYAFGTNHYGGGLPVLDLIPVDSMFSVEDVEIDPLLVLHGPTEVFGYKIGKFAYVTDVKQIPPASYEKMKNLDLLVLGVLRHREHPTHLSVSEALAVLDELKPKMTYFTHIAHDLGHAVTEELLPENIRLAYDGLYIAIDD